jgi:hypothetical protein
MPILVFSAPFPPKDVPKELDDWVSWALDSAPERDCPLVDGSALCAWPGELRLDIGQEGGAFTLLLQADMESRFDLPGDGEHWPQAVTLDKKPAVVLAQGGVPSVLVQRGLHTIAGRFEWSTMPEGLLVPSSIALISLRIDGEEVRGVRREGDGRLWLTAAGTEASQAETLNLTVMRKLSDAIPMRLETRVLVRASGKAREVALPNVLPPGVQTMSVESELPARMEPDGSLRLQVRAGTYTVIVHGRLDRQVDTITAPTKAQPWPSDEVWVFEGDPSLRQVSVSGAPGIDPSRTNLPEEWRSLPAYEIGANGSLKLSTDRRGEPEPAPDDISLSRDMWLDLDGNGFTFRDRLGGNLGRSSRLDLAEPGVLGSVSLGNEAQLVTVNPQDGRSGVELRDASLDLGAEWRLEKSRGELPAVGWSEDVSKLSATLHLPPGFTLLGGRGVDELPGTWWESWNLFSFFFVLIMSLAIGKLTKWWVGLATLLAMVLAHNEDVSPAVAWIPLLITLGLLLVLPEGWFKFAARIAWWVSVVIVAAVLVPFSVDEVRTGLYPQIDPYGAAMGSWVEEEPGGLNFQEENAPAAPSPLQEPEVKQERMDEADNDGMMMRKGEAGGVGGGIPADMEVRRRAKVDMADQIQVQGRGLASSNVGLLYGGKMGQKALQQDPKAIVQTGHGVPTWRWKQWSLSWSGPVAASHRIRLYMLTPAMNLVLKFLEVLLMVGITLLVVRRGLGAGVKLNPPTKAVPPGGVPPKDALPKDALPKDALPKDALPKDALPKDALPKDVPPKDVPPKDALPQKKSAQEGVPQQAVPPAGVSKPSVPPAGVSKPSVPPAGVSKPSVPPPLTGISKPSVPPAGVSKPSVPPADVSKPSVPPADVSPQGESKKGVPPGAAATVLVLGLLAPLSAWAQGDQPSNERLEELRAKLTRTESCTDECVSVSNLSVSVRGEALVLTCEVHAAVRTSVRLPGPSASFTPSRVTVDGKPSSALRLDDEGFIHLRLEPGRHVVEAAGLVPNVATLTLELRDVPHLAQADAPGWTVDGIDENGHPDGSIQLARVASEEGGATSFEESTYPPFFEVERVLDLGLPWLVSTSVRRLTPLGTAAMVRVPLLPGESVTESNLQVENGEVVVSMSRDVDTVSWSSTLAEVQTLTLEATPGRPLAEVWTLGCSAIVQCEFKGPPPVRRKDGTALRPTFRPWPGEKLEIKTNKPKGAPGQSVTVDGVELEVSPGTRMLTGRLALQVRTSRGGLQKIELPSGASIKSLTVAGVSQPFGPEDRALRLTLSPGSQEVLVQWQQEGGLSALLKVPQVKVEGHVANTKVILNLPEDRWLLWAAGPSWGPAILFWGFLLTILLGGLILGRVSLSPLKSWQWMLLALGLTQVPVGVSLVLVGWFFALEWRARNVPSHFVAHNILQVVLAVWTLVAAICLVSSVYSGLAVQPDMQVEGNGSNNSQLVWFVDRAVDTLPTPWALSVPLFIWKLIMLAWALWLAWSVVKWAPWAFGRWSHEGIWKSAPTPPKPQAR